MNFGTRSLAAWRLGFAPALALYSKAEEEGPWILLGWAFLSCHHMSPFKFRPSMQQCRQSVSETVTG